MKAFTKAAARAALLGAGALGLAAALPAGEAADAASWKAAAIADALAAAPPAVTADAAVYGWTADGALRLAREGAGPYTCVASGAFSVRLGKPPLPYPDPMCLDRNAWAFLQAVWAGKAEGGGALPHAPGLVWMLAGMNVSRTAVDVGAAAIEVAQAGAGGDDAAIVQMSPHVMIMPLPADEAAADMPTSYSLAEPTRPWIMAAGKPHEHLMVHFSAADAQALMAGR